MRALIDLMDQELELVEQAETFVQSLARESSETGDTPLKVAERHLADPDVTPEMIRWLALRGLAEQIAFSLAATRRTPPQRTAQEDTDLKAEYDAEKAARLKYWKDKHDQMDCTSPSGHIGNFGPGPGWTTYKNCVRKMEAEQRDKTIAEFDWDACMDQLALHSIKRLTSKLHDIVLQGSEGQMKALETFDRSDVAHWRTKTWDLAAAWTERHDWFVVAETALEAQSVTSIHELAPDTLLKLEFLAEEAWGRNPQVKGDV